MKVRDVMTEREKLSVVTSVSFLPDAARLMRESDTGIIPVVDDKNQDQIIGLITDRDIAVRAVADGVDLKNAKVQDFMSKDLNCISPDLDTNEAAQKMASNQIHRLCVVDNGKLVGMIALGDLAEIAPDQGQKALEGISKGAKVEDKA